MATQKSPIWLCVLDNEIGKNRLKRRVLEESIIKNIKYKNTKANPENIITFSTLSEKVENLELKK